MAVTLAAVVAAGVIYRRGRWRLASSPVSAHALAPEIGFAFALAMLLAGPALVALVRLAADGAWQVGDEPSRTDYARAAGLAYAAQAVVVIVWLSMVRRAAGVASAPGPAVDSAAAHVHRPTHVSSAVRGLVVLLLVWPIAATAGGAVSWIVERLGGAPPDLVAHETLSLLTEGRMDVAFVALSALVVVAAPLLEEVLYRGLVQSSLRVAGLAPWTAIVVTSVIFAAMHWSNTAPHAVASLFVLSLGFGWAYERTGRLAAPMAMHVAFNLVNLVLARTLLGGGAALLQ